LICTTSLFLNAGLSTSLVASAFDGTTNITSQCSFTWLSSNEALATVTPNPDTRSAIALRKSTSSGVTITATCKGVSGVFNLI
jgi:hypothetical protein